MAQDTEGSTAVNLMKMALALLDRNGETLAAARLQHAIDTAERTPVGAPSSIEIDQFLKSRSG